MPYPLPEYDMTAFRAALAGKAYSYSVIPHETYADMLTHYANVGPKKFKYQLKDLNGTIRTVRFHKDILFYIEKDGTTYVTIYDDERLVTALGFDFPSPEEAERIQQANHTGNHHRNRYVRVPTAPGQPVRG